MFPSAIFGSVLMFNQLAQLDDRYYLKLPPSATSWNSYAQVLFLSLNIVSFLSSRYMIKNFDGNFQALELSGSFGVGHKLIYINKSVI